jgi:hypothetical protein
LSEEIGSLEFLRDDIKRIIQTEKKGSADWWVLASDLNALISYQRVDDLKFLDQFEVKLEPIIHPLLQFAKAILKYRIDQGVPTRIGRVALKIRIVSEQRNADGGLRMKYQYEVTTHSTSEFRRGDEPPEGAKVAAPGS